MPLVAAAVVPHSPLLLPNVGHEHFAALKRTRDALEQLAAECYARQCDALLVLTPHGDQRASCSFLVASKLHGDLAAFGDLGTSLDVNGAPGIAARWRSALLRQGVTVAQRTEELLDYGVAVPLLYLARPADRCTVIPLRLGAMTPAHAFALGVALSAAIHETPERIGVLASADLAHQSPGGGDGDSQGSAKAYDTHLLKLIREKRFRDVVTLDRETVAASSTCGYVPLVTLLGLLDSRSLRPNIVSYERPFGVGHAVIDFTLS